MDSSFLKAEHIHVLSSRARFRGNDACVGCRRRTRELRQISCWTAV